ELAKVLEVSPPAVSSLVGSLEQAGFVERAEAPDDRRVTLVSLSAHGRETLLRERATHRARVIELLQHFAPAEIETFLDVMTRLHEHMSESEAEADGGGEPDR
ncbi:MAG TPA: MarR family transcriptional regulator, partial [Limnochordia bacterium]|nr:MarR family transcriptional regulator [Limnochordia bacterium]